MTFSIILKLISLIFSIILFFVYWRKCNYPAMLGFFLAISQCLNALNCEIEYTWPY